MLKIEGFKEEIEELKTNSKFNFNKADVVVKDKGYISDEEINRWGNFSEHEKAIIKEQYSKYPKGFFPNPFCALH